MPTFEDDKETAIRRMREFDRSNIGSVDKPVIGLIDLINSHPDHYTTSSCAGRIVLMQIPDSGKKRDAQFLFREHRTVSIEEILLTLRRYEGEDEVWFRQDPVILHICSRTIEDAHHLINLLRPIGFKRCGIFSIQPNRVMIEAIAVEFIILPVQHNGKLLIDESKFSKTVEIANMKLLSTYDRIKRAEKALLDDPIFTKSLKTDSKLLS